MLQPRNWFADVPTATVSGFGETEALTTSAYSKISVLDRPGLALQCFVEDLSHGHDMTCVLRIGIIMPGHSALSQNATRGVGRWLPRRAPRDFAG